MDHELGSDGTLPSSLKQRDARASSCEEEPRAAVAPRRLYRARDGLRRAPARWFRGPMRSGCVPRCWRPVGSDRLVNRRSSSISGSHHPAHGLCLAPVGAVDVRRLLRAMRRRASSGGHAECRRNHDFAHLHSRPSLRSIAATCSHPVHPARATQARRETFHLPQPRGPGGRTVEEVSLALHRYPFMRIANCRPRAIPPHGRTARASRRWRGNAPISCTPTRGCVPLRRPRRPRLACRWCRVRASWEDAGGGPRTTTRQPAYRASRWLETVALRGADQVTTISRGCAAHRRLDPADK